jgi:hypothetical protein
MSKNEDGRDPTEREIAMMQTFAQTMRTIIDPLVAKIEALEAAKLPKVERRTGDEIHAEMMKALRGQSDATAELGLVEMIEGCMSDGGAADREGVLHGATFDAETHFKPVLVDGKLVGKMGTAVCKTIRNYMLPTGYDAHLADGGLVPSGMKIVPLDQLSSGEGDVREGYGQWLAETFWMADLKRFVGRPIPAHVRPALVAKSVQSG